MHHCDHFTRLVCVDILLHTYTLHIHTSLHHFNCARYAKLSTVIDYSLFHFFPYLKLHKAVGIVNCIQNIYLYICGAVVDFGFVG